MLAEWRFELVSESGDPQKLRICFGCGLSNSMATSQCGIRVLSQALRIMFCRPDMGLRKLFIVASILFALLSTASNFNPAMASCGDYLHTRSSRPLHHVPPDKTSGNTYTDSATSAVPVPDRVIVPLVTDDSRPAPFRSCDSPVCRKAPLPASVPTVPLERFETDDRLLLTGKRDPCEGLSQWQPRRTEISACALSGFPFRLMFPPDAAC